LGNGNAEELCIPKSATMQLADEQSVIGRCGALLQHGSEQQEQPAG